MAIIDLKNGKLTDKAGAAPPIEQPQQSGGIIDLDTGQFMSSSAPSGVPGLSTTGAEFTPPDLPDRTTRATQELQELGSGSLSGLDKLGIAKVSALIPLTTDPREIADILKSTFGEDVGINTDEKGNWLLHNRVKNITSVINQPGLSAMDAIQMGGLATTFGPAARLGGAALKAGAFGLQGLKAGALGGAAGSGLTQSVIEGFQQGAGGEINPIDIGLAAGLGGAAEAVMPAFKAVARRRDASRLGVEAADVAETVGRIKSSREAVEGLESATGKRVGLFQGQQTQQPSTLVEQSLLPQLDASSKKAILELEKQNIDVFDATMSLVNTIAPEGVAATGSARFRTAAKKALVESVNARSAAVKPLYDDAFKEARINGQVVDLKPVSEFVKAELKGLVSDDPASIALNSFMKRLKGVKEKDTPASAILDASGNPITPAVAGKVKPLSLEQLQSAKRTTDSVIDKSGGVILNAAQKNAKRLLTQAEKLYVEQMGKLSPKFKAANTEFARLSPAVKDLEDSIVGQVSNLKDTNLKDISGKIFNATETNPTVIKQAKKVIDSVDPGAWNDLMRVEFQRRVGGMSARVDDQLGELVGNTPGQLRRAIFGNDPKRQVLFSGMNGAQKKNFLYLEAVLKRAESGRNAGSSTAPNQEALKRLRGTFGVIRDAILKPFQSAQSVGEGGLFNRNVSNLADVLFNPKWEPKVRELRALNPNTERAAKILSELLDAVKPAVQSTRIDEE